MIKFVLQHSYIDRVRLEPPLKTPSKNTLRFYISSPQQYEQKFLVLPKGENDTHTKCKHLHLIACLLNF